MLFNFKSIFVLVSLALHCQAYPACFQEEQTWEHATVVDSMDGTDTPMSCQNQCSSNDQCTHFSWYKDSELNPEYPEVSF